MQNRSCTRLKKGNIKHDTYFKPSKEYKQEEKGMTEDDIHPL